MAATSSDRQSRAYFSDARKGCLTFVGLALILVLGSARAEDLNYCRKGVDAGEIGDFALAVNHFTACIEKGNLTIEKLAAAFYNRGNVRLQMGEYHQAIKDYDEVIYLEPRYAPTYIMRGNAHVGLGEYDQAIKDFDEAIRLRPDYALGYHNRRLAYYYKDNHDLAIRGHKDARHLNSDNGQVLFAETMTKRKSQDKYTMAGSPLDSEAAQIVQVSPLEIDRRSFAVHLGSVRTEDMAKHEWTRLQGLFPKVLSQRSLIVRSVEVEAGGTFHRVLTGPFEDRAKAQGFCAEFRSKKHYCLVVRLDTQ